MADHYPAVPPPGTDMQVIDGDHWLAPPGLNQDGRVRLRRALGYPGSLHERYTAGCGKQGCLNPAHAVRGRPERLPPARPSQIEILQQQLEEQRALTEEALMRVDELERQLAALESPP